MTEEQFKNEVARLLNEVDQVLIAQDCAVVLGVVWEVIGTVFTNIARQEPAEALEVFDSCCAQVRENILKESSNEHITH